MFAKAVWSPISSRVSSTSCYEASPIVITTECKFWTVGGLSIYKLRVFLRFFVKFDRWNFHKKTNGFSSISLEALRGRVSETYMVHVCFVCVYFCFSVLKSVTRNRWDSWLLFYYYMYIIFNTKKCCFYRCFHLSFVSLVCFFMWQTPPRSQTSESSHQQRGGAEACRFWLGKSVWHSRPKVKIKGGGVWCRRT